MLVIDERYGNYILAWDGTSALSKVTYACMSETMMLALEQRYKTLAGADLNMEHISMCRSWLKPWL